jgi:hypothetical protein
MRTGGASQFSAPGAGRAAVYAVFFAGTFLPAFRASERPMAMACFELVTFRPLPERSLPSFIARISVSTDLDAAGLYFLVLVFAELFFALAFFAAGIGSSSSNLGSVYSAAGCRLKSAEYLD